MATHAEIIARLGKDQEVALRLRVNVHQVRDWRLRNSIPAEKWKALADANMVSLEELAEGAAAKTAAA